MKKTVFFVTMLTLALFATAQSYKEVSDQVLLNRYKEAKEELDKRMTNAKFISKPDAYILKTAIYAGLSMDTLNPQKEQLLSEAEAAFLKYREMDGPNYPLIKDLVYKAGPVNLYSSLFTKAYKDYEASRWQPAFETFKKVADLSDILGANQLLNSPVDTTVLILTAYTAENSNHRDEAAKYYARLAEHRVAGAGNEFIYRFLVLNSFEKNDMAAFEKYKALGKQLYPKSEYFDYDKTDFAVGLSVSFDTRLKAIEDVLAKDPSDYKANLTLAQLVYDTLHPRGDGVPPANTAELETKMINSLEKAATLKPDDELPYLVLGDHFIDKSDKLNDLRAAHVEDMKKRTKPGTQPSKADIQKRDELDKEYGDAFDKARVPYEKAAAIFAAKQQSLSGSQKQQYRKLAGYLGDIYNFKKAQSKVPADAAKYTAEAKKWNDMYESMR
jgi:hypothetical protein